MADRSDPTRRRVLQTVGAGVGTAGIATAAAGQRGDNGEQIIGLAAGASTSIATDRAVEVTREIDFGSVGKAIVGRFRDSDVQALSAHPGVRYTEANGRMYALEIGAESAGDVSPAEETPYGIGITDADAAINQGNTGDGITIAVVDTGIDPDHETLAENIIGGYAVDDAQCSDGCDEPWGDDQGHGTHVTGSAAAAKNGIGLYGVAPDADLLGVKVLGDTGGSFAGVAEGIEWSANNGADVINLSLGGPESSVVSDAVEYADSNGVVVVSAAGNAGPCSDCVNAPANHPDVIAVSATDSSDNLASFSSTGPEIDIAAPGAAVNSSVPNDGYSELSGTSMASPHVAGAAATVLANGTAPGDVKGALESGAEDVGLGGNEQGAGRLNVLNAIDGGGGGDPVAVSTGQANGVGETSATLTGTLTSLSDDPSADVWFEYGPAGSGLPEMADAGTAGDGDSFSADISGLDSGTTYEFVAVASTGDKTAQGSLSSFETDSSGGFCFITTATADETETLDSLRRFRDDSMRATPVGKGLVGLYYRISPPIARTLGRHPDSVEAGLTRRVIEASASLSDSQAETGSRIRSAALGVMLTMLYVVGLVVGVAGHASLRTRELFGQ